MMQPKNGKASAVARPVAPKAARVAERPLEKPVAFSLKHPHARAVAVAA
jgi:hypothetical protein